MKQNAKRPLVDPNVMSELLKLAAVPPSNITAATRWLEAAIIGARSTFDAAKQRPMYADHNDLLIDVEKSAKAVSRAIERLRKHPTTWRAFWRSSVFGPVYLDRFELKHVISTVANISGAAKAARSLRKGRPPVAHKQHVIDLAFGFFFRFSQLEPSGTPTGAFAKFARAFYREAGGGQEDEEKLDRQIRQALKRLPIDRERARQKSAKNT